jgi:phenylacetate-CoA ligase
MGQKSRLLVKSGFFIEDWIRSSADSYRSLPPGLRNIVGRVYRSLPSDWRYGSEYRKTIELLKKTETYSSQDLVNFQLFQAQELINHAYNEVPYYRDLFNQVGLKPNQITTISDLQKIPFLTKDLVRKHSVELLASNIPPSRRLYMNTGGSTGIPLELYYEKGVSRAREWAFMHTIWRRFGWEEGDSSVMLRGLSVPHGLLWQFEPIRNRLIMSAYHLNEMNLPSYYQKIQEFSPKFIEAYPSNLMILAQYMNKNRLPPIPSIKAILAGSENLFPFQRELLESVFNCKVISWYGHGEIVALGGECEVSHDLHLFPEYGIVELISEDGNPITGGGKMGEIVATGFNNKVMPLLRYQTGDMGIWSTGACKCGRNYPRLLRVEGRKQELVVTSDGTIVTLTGLIFAQHFQAFSQIKQMQLIQEKMGELNFLIVPDSSFSQRESEAEIRQKIYKAVGNKLTIFFNYVDTLPRTPSGKHLFLVQKLQISDYLR